MLGSAARMLALTRRRYRERQDCRHVHYGDVHVGTIAIRAGVPVDVDQWRWDYGHYPPSHHGRHVAGTAQTFEQARTEFEAAWNEYLPKCSQTDFDEYRRSVAWTSWKYAMWDKGCRMPTQSTDGRSRCFVVSRSIPLAWISMSTPPTWKSLDEIDR